MAKTYKITLTEEQVRVTQKCLNSYMRLLMGQTYDFVEELAFYNYDKRIECLDEEQQKKVFDSCIQKRDAIEEVLKKLSSASSSRIRMVFLMKRQMTA